MFWKFPEWNNAFLIQFCIILLVYIYGHIKRINTTDLLSVIFLYSFVPFINISYGTAGVLYLSDIYYLGLFFSNIKHINKLLSNKFLLVVSLFFIIWPITSTIFSIISSASLIDYRILALQEFRYFIFTSVVYHVYCNFERINLSLSKLLDIQILLISLFSFSLLVSFAGLVHTNGWWEIARYDNFDETQTFGKGAMFLYKAGIGCFTTLGSILILYKLSLSKRFLTKFVLIIIELLLLISCIFSGSRQGFIFFLISLFIALFLFKYSKRTIVNICLLLLLSIILFINFVDNEIIQWIRNNYFQYFFGEYDFITLLNNRNSHVSNSISKFSNAYYYIFGRGLGGNIVPTESDYYNALSYFGLIGIIIYIVFIIYCYKHINLKEGHHRLISLLLTVMLLFGFQQWFLMSWTISNGTNNLIILFFIGMLSKNITNKKEKIRNFQ